MDSRFFHASGFLADDVQAAGGTHGIAFLVNRFLTRIIGLLDTGSRVKAMVDDLNEKNENEIIIEDSE